MKEDNQKQTHKIIAFSDIGDKILLADDTGVIWEVKREMLVKVKIEYPKNTTIVKKPKKFKERINELRK